ncbi:MAG: aldehyde-activating protein [Proteobacteria bacterium]|nr:aldehyde-activating protein [Pseudomonadota bacterium]
MLSEFQGSCHCGAIGFSYRTSIAPERWSIRACQCSFCRAHDTLSTSDPAGSLEFTASDPDLLNRYRFGLRTADFLLCRECGIYIGALIETGKGRFGIISMHALVEAPENLAATEPISYDSEDIAERVSRRETRWTPVKTNL